MRLFLAGASFDPSTGGPAYSVAALGGALAKAGVEVGLWAPDGTAATSPHVSDQAGLTPLTGTLDEALARFGTPDLIHDNGIWLPHNHAIARFSRRYGIPRVLTPRGMLEPLALKQRGLKKKIAWALYQRRDLKSAHLLHATTESEEANCRALGLTGPYAVVANGVDLPAPVQRVERAPDAPLTALFVSRVQRLKGLPMLLQAWAKLRPQGWQLVIAGPDLNGHTAQLTALAEKLDLQEQVRFVGPVYDDEKRALFEQANLFVLPTYTENFGVAVAEALAYGVPVLTTRGAPWEVLLTHGCGWWVAPEEAAILEGLRAAIACPESERREMGRRGAAMVADRFDWDRIAMQLHRHYEALLAA